jgi:hypothetical protein
LQLQTRYRLLTLRCGSSEIESESKSGPRCKHSHVNVNCANRPPDRSVFYKTGRRKKVRLRSPVPRLTGPQLLRAERKHGVAHGRLSWKTDNEFIRSLSQCKLRKPPAGPVSFLQNGPT